MRHSVFRAIVNGQDVAQSITPHRNLRTPASVREWRESCDACGPRGTRAPASRSRRRFSGTCAISAVASGTTRRDLRPVAPPMWRCRDVSFAARIVRQLSAVVCSSVSSNELTVPSADCSFGSEMVPRTNVVGACACSVGQRCFNAAMSPASRCLRGRIALRCALSPFSAISQMPRADRAPFPSPP